MAKDGKGNVYVSEAQARAQTVWNERQIEKEAARIVRQEARANRTDEQQLARLDKLLGPGVGAKRERARLAKRIKERKTKAEKKEDK